MHLAGLALQASGANGSLCMGGNSSVWLEPTIQLREGDAAELARVLIMPLVVLSTHDPLVQFEHQSTGFPVGVSTDMLFDCLLPGLDRSTRG